MAGCVMAQPHIWSRCASGRELSTPTTLRGGTSEIEMAAPGSESATSSRLMAKASDPVTCLMAFRYAAQMVNSPWCDQE